MNSLIYTLSSFFFIISIIGYIQIFRIEAGWVMFLLLSIIFLYMAKKWEKIKKIYQENKSIRVTILTFSMLLVIYIVSMEILMHNAIQTKQTKTDYIIVLGAGLKNGKPSAILKNRLDKAKEVYLEQKNAKIIVSGGLGYDEGETEGEVMSKYLSEKGINKKDIIIENKATSTYENLKFSKNLIRKKDSKVTIVTSDFHIFRANYIANRLDLHFNSVASKTPITTIPQAHVREYLAIVKTYLFDK